MMQPINLNIYYSIRSKNIENQTKFCIIPKPELINRVIFDIYNLCLFVNQIQQKNTGQIHICKYQKLDLILTKVI
jgi:hypothetical protein